MTPKGSFRIAVRKYPPFERAIRTQWEAFESQAQTGLNLDLVSLDLEALERSLFTDGGMADGTWDVAFVATDWVAAMHLRGCALDLAPMLATQPPHDYPSGWADSLLRLQCVEEAVLGVPYHDGPECLIYRRDLFEDIELRVLYQERFQRQLAPPTTWQEFWQIARFLQATRKPIYGTVFAAYPDGHNSVYDFLLQLWTRGGDLFDASGAVHFETRAAIESLTYYRDILNDAAAVHPECRSFDSVKAGLAFAEGSVAMMVNWFGFATMAETDAVSAVRGLVEVTHIPHLPQTDPVSLNVYWILSIAAGSCHIAEAWNFLRHTMSAPMDKLTTMSGAIGCRRSTWTDPEVNGSIGFYHRIEELHQYAREIPRRQDWPQIASIIDHLVTRCIGSLVPIPELLRDADDAVAQLLSHG